MPKFKPNTGYKRTGFKMAGFSAFDRVEEPKEPTDEKKAEMAKKGLAYNPKTGGWMKVWTGDK